MVTPRSFGDLHSQAHLGCTGEAERHAPNTSYTLQWTDPKELPGIGEYAADAYRMFCRNEWQEMRPPADKDLLKYYNFLKETGGQGMGFERERFEMPASDSASHDLHCWPGMEALCPPAGDVHDVSSPHPPSQSKSGDDVVMDLDD